jgi:mono/diheme cytochrome c family protein
MEHYARYCAVCHANDGSGLKTPLGTGLYPKPPDLRAAATQSLTDGELFYIIDNGVRFTGMPAFGTGESTPAGDKQLWELVQFVRRLPRITPDELATMEGMNVL